MNKSRVRKLNNIESGDGNCVVYWMSRDQRVKDNWALVHAQALALETGVPLVVVFALAHGFLGATWRQYDFMLRGLNEVETDLRRLGIQFLMLRGDKKVPELVIEAVQKFNPSVLVCDFSPLRIGRMWREYIAQKVTVPMHEVDSHNVVPAWVISDHQEFAAHTIRPKLHRTIDEYLEDFDPMQKQNSSAKFEYKEWSVDELLEFLDIDRSIAPVDWIVPGEKAAREALDEFLDQRLEGYGELRNVPTANGQSNLSPYLHFGQLSAQRVTIEVMARSGKRLCAKLAEATHSAEAFLEELIVRRELADNFCLYNQNYDNLQGGPQWAIKSLDAHKDDAREHLYTLEQLEKAQTSDPIWNAAQIEMVRRGKMHGYMRMYWAKKILEWTATPAQALEFAIYLNDKYQLDGRDPNGYVGIMWSICGVHDRPWFERPVFGAIRYMNAQGLKNKFDTAEYIARNA